MAFVRRERDVGSAERRAMRWAVEKVCLWGERVVYETAGQWADAMGTNSERGKGEQRAG